MIFIQSIFFSPIFRAGAGLLLLWLAGCSGPPPKVEKPWIPDVLVFAGDTVPLSDPEVRERLEKELWINAYWYSSTAQWIRRAARWKPVLDSVLRKNGLPEDLQYLVAIESGYDNVTSNKGAVGFWQLMEPTAREFGLRINPVLDERLDPIRATGAACGQLRRGYSVFRSWPEAVVAYNIGAAGLKSVLESQYCDSFYDAQINPESGRYWFRVLAAKLLITCPERYGFTALAAPEELASRTETIREDIPDLPWWCRKQGFSYRCFRSLNPAIKTRGLTGLDTLGPVQVQIPLACRVYSKNPVPDLPAPDSLREARQVIQNHLVNDKNMAALKTAVAPTAAPEWYTVAAGDYLEGIARKTGVPAGEIMERNPSLGKRKGRVLLGEKLRLSPPKPNE